MHGNFKFVKKHETPLLLKADKPLQLSSGYQSPSSLCTPRIASADPEGGQGGPDPPPWKITSYMGFYRE